MALRHLVDRVLEHPAVYGAWQAPFASSKFAPVERQLANRDVRRVLDVGCGPGTNALRFASADYVGVDINDRYLAIARTRYRGRFVHADLETADLETADLAGMGAFDTIIVNSFLHHLADDSVARVLNQLRLLLEANGRVHVLELVDPERRSLAKVMARLDRGRFARPLAAWRVLFEAYFESVSIEPYQFGGGLWSMVYFQGKTR